jgi:hypothetical protein
VAAARNRIGTNSRGADGGGRVGPMTVMVNGSAAPGTVMSVPGRGRMPLVC